MVSGWCVELSPLPVSLADALDPGGGVFWKEFEEKSKSLGDMGITAAWLPRTSSYLPPPQTVADSACSSYQGFLAERKRLRCLRASSVASQALSS